LSHSLQTTRPPTNGIALTDHIMYVQVY